MTEAFECLEGYPHNSLRLDCEQIEETRPFMVLHTAMFGSCGKLDERKALEDIQSFFSGYRTSRLYHTAIIERTSDMSPMDRLDYLRDLDVPWAIFLDGIDHLSVKKRS